MSIVDLAFAVALAPIKARCMVPGLTGWVKTKDGWRDDATGVLVTGGYMADLISMAQSIEEPLS
jgi:hypothetical protein